MDKEIPNLTRELIKHLEQIFPMDLPKVDDSLSHIQRKAGHQDVLRYIKRKLQEEDENVLR